MITTQCENCGKFLEIPDQYRGRTGKCNACGGPIRVPDSRLPPVPAWKMGCLYSFLGLMILMFVAIIFAPRPETSNAPQAAAEAPRPARAEPEPAQPPTGYTDAHRAAVDRAFKSLGMNWPYRILPNFDGILFVEITMPNNGPQNLGELAKSLIVTTRNAVYETPGADPDWWYNIKFFGPPPGPGLTNLVGVCEMDHHGRIEWEGPAAGANFAPARPVTPTPQPTPTVVYIAPKGKKYHDSYCSTVRNGSTPVQITQAKAHGYQPCKVCNPPTR